MVANEDVLVIGAGPAGVASAYYLEQAEISYRVIDKAEEIASTWNSLYPSLRLNTTRFFSHLPGARFPLRYGIFPTGKQYHRYVEQFAKSHNFNIEFGVTVYQISPKDDGWQVETSQGTCWYPCVISASGRFNYPIVPHFPGEDTFTGKIMHAQEYHGPEPFTGKRVMVVGNGPSGVDIATELGRRSQARKPVLLSQRTGVVLRPRYPYGLPKHVWVMLSEILPKAIGKPLIDHITGLKFENLDQIGIKTPRTAEESSAAGGTRGRDLIRAAKSGTVISVDGPETFDGDNVILVDGSRHAVDVVILATGYRPALFHYFHEDVEIDNKGWPLRIDEAVDGRRQVKGYPGLYLVGVFYTGKGAMYNFNVEAEIAAEEITLRLKELGRR